MPFLDGLSNAKGIKWQSRVQEALEQSNGKTTINYFEGRGSPVIRQASPPPTVLA